MSRASLDLALVIEDFHSDSSQLGLIGPVSSILADFIILTQFILIPYLKFKFLKMTKDNFKIQRTYIKILKYRACKASYTLRFIIQIISDIFS